MKYELLRILRRFEGARIIGDGNVWRLKGHLQNVNQCKTELLDAICHAVRPFVRYEEAPRDFHSLKDATEISQQEWRLPQGALGAEVLSWLYMGNWQLYVKDDAIAEIPDLCRSSDAEVQRFIAESEISVVIDSFHDDDFWVVSFGEETRPGR